MCRSVASTLGFLLLLLIVAGSARAAEVDRSRYLTVYGGVGTDSGIEDLPRFDFELEGSYFLALALAKRLGAYQDYLAWEAEGQVVKHFAKQDHFEFNFAFVFRWLAFPWDDYVDTSIAVGEGVSYATHLPEIERERSDKNARFLNYLMFEFAFSPPENPRWAAVFRVHHRSGVYGLYNGVSVGSNFLGLGMKYSF